MFGFIVLFLLSSCSNKETQLDCPQDKQEVLSQEKGKFFGELKFSLKDQQNKEESKK